MKTNKSKTLKIQSFLSFLMILTGIALVVFMITVEGELGAIPLLLIVFGTGWYLITRSKLDTQHA